MISIKNKLYIIFILFFLGLLYSYANFYGENPSIIIGFDKDNKSDFLNLVQKKLLNEKFEFTIDIDHKIGVVLRFKSTEDQFNAYESLKKNNFSNLSLNILESKNIGVLKIFGIKPMKLGLDLRGGIYLLIKVNINNNLNTSLKCDIFNFVTFLNLNKQSYKKITIKKNNIVKIKFFDKLSNLNSVILGYIKSNFYIIKNGDNFIILSLNRKKFFEIRKQVVEQTIFILNKRINELGISDSLVTSRGKNNIVIEIAGIQDISRAKKIIGKTATLKFMIVDLEKKNNSYKVFYEEQNKEIFLKKQILLTGDSVVYASSGFEHSLNKPCINIKISKKNIKEFEAITKKNIGNLMAIIYKENILTPHGEELRERVISVATIMSALGHEFQITGLTFQESKDLALLLRSGSLPASIFIVEEKVIGPTIGEDNLKKGLNSVLISFFCVFFFMLFKYKFLGLIANFALIINVFILIAIMSFIEVTLTLSGLAGIAVMLAISIDGNVLIFERIKEELLKKGDVFSCIEFGFTNAYSSIIDSNLTTLIVGLVLFILGDGPVKGFAITLSLGVITSMFSCIFITKSFIDFLYLKRVKIL